MVAFEAKPSFRDYQKVENFAGEAWSQIKPDLLDILRESEHWYTTEVKVDIFLHEGLIYEAILLWSRFAIATVRSDSYYASELLEQVMDAALRTTYVAQAKTSFSYTNVIELRQYCQYKNRGSAYIYSLLVE